MVQRTIIVHEKGVFQGRTKLALIHMLLKFLNNILFGTDPAKFWATDWERVRNLPAATILTQ